MVSLPSNATFSGFPKNKQACEPHHRLLTVIVGWVYPTDDVRAERPWHRGLRRVPLRLPRVWCVPLTYNWKDGEGAWPQSTPEHSEPIRVSHCAFHGFWLFEYWYVWSSNNIHQICCNWKDVSKSSNRRSNTIISLSPVRKWRALWWLQARAP